MATDKPSYPSDAAEKFVVRLPPGMREQIAEAARANNRSMNAELVARVTESFAVPEEPYVTMAQLKRVFGKIRDDQDRAMMAVTLVRDMLGTYVKQLYRRLTLADQEKEDFQAMVQMANAAVEMRVDELADAAAKIMGNAPGFDQLGNASDFFKYLGEANKEATERRRKMLDDNPKTPSDKGSGIP